MPLLKWTARDTTSLIKLLNKNNNIDFAKVSLKNVKVVANLKGLKAKSERDLQLLTAYQRLLKIAPQTELDTLVQLLKDGLQSAIQIADLPQHDFIKKYSPLFANDTNITIQFHESAKAIKTKVLIEFMNRKQSKQVAF